MYVFGMNIILHIKGEREETESCKDGGCTLKKSENISYNSGVTKNEITHTHI